MRFAPGSSPIAPFPTLYHLFTRKSQGLQLSSEAATFGSFTHSFLSAFRDDFPKLPILHFQFLAEPVPQSIDLDLPVSPGILRSTALD